MHTSLIEFKEDQLFEEWNDIDTDSSPDEYIHQLFETQLEPTADTTENYQRSKDYWLNRIETLPPAPELPVLHNSATTHAEFKRRTAQLAPKDWNTLKQRAALIGLTPLEILLAVFADVLTLWSKQPKLTINLILLEPELSLQQDIADHFFSLLLAVDNSLSASFKDRTFRIQEQLRQDLEHRYFTGVEVMQALADDKGEADHSMPVVFTNALSLSPSNVFQTIGAVIDNTLETTEVWLNHQVFEEDDGTLFLVWDAVEERFPEGLLDDMFEAYHRFLPQLTDLSNSEPAWLAKGTEFLIPPAHLSQRNAINATAAPISDDLLHTLFLAQVRNHGHDSAVISPQRTLTYLELSQLAAQVGSQLRQMGAMPNTLVAIVLEKGWEQVVAAFGILMSGAAYLPIDPKLPKDRRWYLLEQGQVKFVLTVSRLNEKFSWPEGIQRLCLDDDSNGEFPPLKRGVRGDLLFPSPLVKGESPPLESVQTPTDLAYVIFTSGSTGKPKGVAIDHRGAVNTVKNINQRFGIGHQDRVLALSALNFDLSVYDIFGLLAVGGTIVFPDATLTKEPKHWLELITQHRVTVWNTVPALMQMLVDHLNQYTQIPPDSLRLTMMSGDWIPLKLPTQIKKLWPQMSIISLGGATEASIWSIYYPIEIVESTWKSIPYGKPLTNQTFQVLNHALEPCPIWVPGELYIGGIGLAQCYWRDKEKTQASFIIHPQTQERLYKTGDLGRYLPDGNIQFLGRIDHQVKIRGYRIELEEIEAVLHQEPSVQQAIIVVRENEQGQKYLASYIHPPHLPERVSIQAHCLVFHDHSITKFKLEDVSRKGIRLSGAIPPTVKVGKKVHLSLRIPKKNTHEKLLKGRVAWGNEQQIGIKLPAKKVKALINQNVKKRIKQFKAGNSKKALKSLKRFPIQTPCRVAYSSQEPLIELKTENISFDGLCLVGVPTVWEKDRKVPLYLRLPNVSEEICVEGQIAWYQPPKAGIKFTGSKSEKSKLRQVLGELFEDYNIKVKRIQRTSAAAQYLRDRLTEKLPAYMVPSHFVFLKKIPLTANGKINRKALITRKYKNLKEDFETADTETEVFLANLWSEVLALKEVSTLADFFQYGGNSLLAGRVVARIRDFFKIELPLQSLFEYPTIAKLAEQIDRLRQQASDSVKPELKPVADKTNIPLSFSQQQLWLVCQLAPEVPVYNEPFTIGLGGPIDIEALEHSFNEILHRHEALRTTFSTVDGQPVQIVSLFEAFKLPILDLRDLPANEREPAALQRATAEAKQPFDLSHYPLFRATLVQLDEQDNRLFLTFHHIIIDGVSIYNVLLPELEALYKAFSKGQPSPLEPLSIQYTDFAIWQRQSLPAEPLENQFRYWEQQLADLTTLQLPTDRSRPAHPTFQGSRCFLTVPKKLMKGLKKVGRDEGVTLFVVMLAAFKTLLYRYSGQTDIVIGTPIAGRNRTELEPLMGDFLNTLVLRADFSDNPSFRQLLQQVRKVTMAAYAHQDLPFERLVNKLQPKSSRGMSPLFQVMFDFVPQLAQLDLGWTFSQLDVPTDTAKFDLTMELDERTDGIIGRIEYNTDIFDEATIVRMVGHYQTLLEGIVADIKQPVSHLPLLTAQEQQQLAQWNQTEADFPKDLCIHQLFERQVELTPEAVALVFEGQQLSYHELNARANQVAHYLISLGVKPETLVGICMERSLEMIIGILGILKAGGAYVPLDTSYPHERLEFMLKDAQIQVLLTKQHLKTKFVVQMPICLDTDWQLISQQSEKKPESFVSSNNLVYVIYTSGSTGKPKGVEIQHNSLINLVTWHQRTYQITSNDKASQIAAVAFDASVWELWPYLTRGASIHIPSEEVRASPSKLVEWFTSEAITISFLPTPLAEAVLKEKFPKNLILKTLLTGGDKLHSVPREVLPFNLVNHYGPTESTVVTTSATVKSGKLVEPPIGGPINNTQIFVLDAYLQRVPIGILGELHVGGIGLARGYRNRPELTAEKFISNPFTKNESYLYKTGDLVRYLPDGNLEFLGRIDHQVKVRGFRIELGEIEAVLKQLDSVQDVVVIVREDTPGDKRLVAYLVAKPQSTPSSTELRRFLQQQLPDYMVPAAFVMLEALPLTPNGKIDRKALPQPEGQRADLETAYIAPRNELEQKIATILKTVLQIDQIGVHDNFFELGGNSLLLVQAQEKLVKALNQNMPTVALFQCPSISALAHYLEAEKREQAVFQEGSDRATLAMQARKRRRQR